MDTRYTRNSIPDKIDFRGDEIQVIDTGYSQPVKGNFLEE
jgi:hypothetical protein